MMDRTARNKWQVRAAAAVVFLLGALAGAFALNAYRAWARPDVRDARRERFEQTLESLDLTDEQEAQVRQILKETRAQLRALRRESEPRFEEVRRQTDERLRQVLNAEQWQKFQQLKEEMRGHKRGDPPRGAER